MTIPELDELYGFLSERRQIAAAHERVTAIYPRIIEVGDVEALRLAKAPYKKLQDEIRPSLIYATSELRPDDEIQFHLSDRGHDATVWPRDNSSPVLIEATVASGKARLVEMTALKKMELDTVSSMQPTTTLSSTLRLAIATIERGT
jgi:hypothetical protein